MCYINKILLTNIYSDPKITYEFINFYYENYKKLNNNLTEKGYKIYHINIDNNKISLLEHHRGVIKFFKDKGYITYSDNKNCNYLVGTSECTEESLKKNNLYYDEIIGGKNKPDNLFYSLLI